MSMYRGGTRTELDLLLMGAASLTAVAIVAGAWLYAALVLSLLVERGPAVLGRLPSPDLMPALAMGLIAHPGDPWRSSGFGVSSVAFWSAAAVVGLATAGTGIWLGTKIHGLGGFFFARRRGESHGKSRWARRSDLRQLARPARPERLRPDGIVLGWWGRLVLQTPVEENLLVFGVQRSGKTSSVVVPTLLGWRGPLVATSTKEELVRLTGPHRARRGPVWVFSPLDRDSAWISELGLRPAAWNPVAGITDAARAVEIADLFTADGKAGPSAHWYLSAASLIAGLLLIAHHEAKDLRWVLSRLHMTSLGQYVGLAKSQRDPIAEELLTAFANTPSREAGSIASTARSALSLWVDSRVAAATAAEPESGEPLDLEELLASGGSLYLVAPAEESERLKPLFTALLQSLLAAATQRARRQGGRLSPRLLLALDEVANFARIPRLGGYASTGPGQGIHLLLSFHDLAQLEGIYGPEPARTVWNNCRARLLLPGQGDLRTLEQFSLAIGEETRTYEVPSWNSEGRWSQSQQRLGRPLATPDSLRRLPQAVLLYGSAPPARLQTRRWDQVPAWRAAVEGIDTGAGQQPLSLINRARRRIWIGPGWPVGSSTPDPARRSL